MLITKTFHCLKRFNKKNISTERYLVKVTKNIDMLLLVLKF